MPQLSWIAEQAWLTAASVMAGLLLGVLYQLYSLFIARHGRRPPRRYLVADSLFGVSSIFLVLLFWLVLTDGSWRAANFLFMAAGFLIYHLIFYLPMARAARRFRGTVRPPAPPSRPKRPRTLSRTERWSLKWNLWLLDRCGKLRTTVKKWREKRKKPPEDD